MRSRTEKPKLRLTVSFLVTLLSVLGTTGCGMLYGAEPVEEGPIEPAEPAEASTDVDLGPGIRPLSLGPGDKSSPRISPLGERVAFVLDGYVVEKSLYAQDLKRRTAERFSATNVEWLSAENLAVLGSGSRSDSSARDAEPGSLFVSRPNDPLEAALAEGVQATGVQASGGAMVAAVETRGTEDPAVALVRIRAGGNLARSFPVALQGRVSGLSLSPDGREAAMAVRIESGEDAGRVEIVTYRFSEGEPQRVALLDEGLEVMGAPQQTPRGIYLVAGEEEDEEADYTLYQVSEGSEGYEPVRGIGEDFVPASIAASPAGDSLAVLGRRSSRSPTDLYVLNLASDALDAVTANENMEIKTKPGDLAWSPDGSYVVIVARGVLSGPKVYGSPAEEISSAFYNVYRVPVGTAASTGGRPG